MSRSRNQIVKSLAAAAVLGLSAYGVAFADDSSMSMWTGDSYAFFNSLDYSAGHFDMARAPRASENIATKPAPQLPGADQHAMAPHRALKLPSLGIR